MVYLASFGRFDSYSFFFCQSDIKIFTFVNTAIIILDKYANFANIFLLNLASQFPNYIEISNLVIKLIDDQYFAY